MSFYQKIDSKYHSVSSSGPSSAEGLFTMLKWRLFRWLRFDSHHVLKILIFFNLLLGIYLIFLSSSYRNYNETLYKSEVPYSSNKVSTEKLLSLKNISFQIETNPLPSSNNISKDNVKTSQNSLNNKNNEENSNKPSAQVNAAVANNFNNNDQMIVDDKQVYDSNNRPVLIQADSGGNNAADSYKKVEEDDDKTIDENDKLRIEMIGAKPDEQNSIIHLDLDESLNNKKQAIKPGISILNQRKISIKNNKEADNEDLNKDVISRIIDHNSHIKKNYTKLIIPDNINIDSWSVPDIRGSYNVLQNYIPGDLPVILGSKNITLTTQGSPEFLHHVTELCPRWNSFLSVSVYAPGQDFKLALYTIFYLRQCSLDKCIANQVYWHLIYDLSHSPFPKISSPTTYLETSTFDCSISLDDTIRMLNLNKNYRKAKSLPYPINVLRNVARSAAKTKYLFASDIELYPSVGIVPAFFDLIEREQKGMIKLINPKVPHVYVLPIFELQSGKKSPKTKRELLKLFKTKDAIFFHRYVCDVCQMFPDRDIWINKVPENESMLNVFRVTKRLRDRNQWEPLYIGTNDEPFYDDRLTWDGKRDKMSQMFEMCLMNYDMLILDNAFLIHAPGIKRYNVKDDQKRLVYIKQNYKIYLSIMANLRKKYDQSNC